MYQWIKFLLGQTRSCFSRFPEYLLLHCSCVCVVGSRVGVELGIALLLHWVCCLVKERRVLLSVKGFCLVLCGILDHR